MQNGKSIDASRMVSVNAKSTTGNATELTLPCRQTATPHMGRLSLPASRQNSNAAPVRAGITVSSSPPTNRHRKRPITFACRGDSGLAGCKATSSAGKLGNPADVGITWGTYYLTCLILRPFIGAAIDRCNIKALLVLCFPKDDKEGNTKKAASSQRKTSVKNFINLADCGFAEREFIIKCFSHVYEWSEGQEQPSVKTKELRGEPATSCGKTNPRNLRSKNQRHTR